MKTLEKVFAHNLREMRGETTQAVMAERLDVPLRTYQKLEAGEVIPQAETRHLLAQRLGVPETALFLDASLTPSGNAPEPTIEDIIQVITRQHARLAKIGNVSDRILAILPALDALNDKEFKQLLVHLKMIETARGAAPVISGGKGLKESG